MQLGAASLLLKKKRKLHVGEKVHPWERIMLGSFCTYQ